MPQIQARIDAFKKETIISNQTIQQNYQFGLANRDMYLLINQSHLPNMNETLLYTTKQKMSMGLKKNLSNKQKQNIKGYIQLEASQLIDDKTITDVKIPELEPLMPKCHCVLIEGEGQKIEFKLVLRETKISLCGPPKVLEEHTLLSFDISAKKIKMMRKTVADYQASQKGKKEDDRDKPPDLIFEGNDTLVFNYEKFLKIL